MCEIQETEDRFIVEDSTDGGYVDRMTYNLSLDWTTVWDKELNFISLTLRNEDLTQVILTKDKGHYDYHRAVRAKNRHLKAIKEHLGLEVKKPKEKVRETIIYRESSMRNSLDLIEISDGIIHDKTIDLRWTHKKHNLLYTKHTPEKEALVEEYNQQLKAFKEYQKFMLDRIFKDSDNFEEENTNGYI